MGLRVYWTTESSSRTHEVDFWPQFVAEMRALFEQRNYDGVLIGWPVVNDQKYLRPDVLIITKNNFVVVDFKVAADAGELIKLPEESGWETEPWMVYPVMETTNSKPRPVSSGSEKNNNPFHQLKNQVRMLQGMGVRYVKTCVLIQGDPTIEGVVPGKWASFFKVALLSTFPKEIDSLLNTGAPGEKIDIEKLMSHFSIVEYTEIPDFVFHPSEEIAELRQKLDELAIHVHKTQTDLRTLHSQKPTFNEQPAEVKQRIEDLSQSEARELKLYEIASQKFIAEKAAETARFNAEAEKHRAASRSQESEATQPVAKKRKSRAALFVSAGLVIVAAAAISLVQRQVSVSPAVETCVEISNISNSTDCVEFTPQGVGFRGSDAYLNDIPDYREGNFFVAISDYEVIFSKSDLEKLVGKPLRVSGEVSKSSDGRFKITVIEGSQIRPR